MEGVARELGGASEVPRMMSTPEPEPVDVEDPIPDEESEEEEEEEVGRLKCRECCVYVLYLGI